MTKAKQHKSRMQRRQERVALVKRQKLAEKTRRELAAKRMNESLEAVAKAGDVSPQKEPPWQWQALFNQALAKAVTGETE